MWRLVVTGVFSSFSFSMYGNLVKFRIKKKRKKATRTTEMTKVPTHQKEAAEASDWAATESKLYHDWLHAPTEFYVGEWVFLKLGKAYPEPGENSSKFSPKKTGPFQMTKKVGHNAYEIALPASWKIHPVISTSHLEKSNLLPTFAIHILSWLSLQAKHFYNPTLILSKLPKLDNDSPITTHFAFRMHIATSLDLWRYPGNNTLCSHVTSGCGGILMCNEV